MRTLPPVDDGLFPRTSSGAIRRFWVLYWLAFFAFLPWILVRQLFVSAQQALGAIRTGNRRVELLPGLELLHMANLRSVALTAVFGERFTAIRYRDVLIDPGPPFGARRLERRLDALRTPIRAIVATHAHEEHVGNAALASAKTGAPIHGSAITLRAVSRPLRLSPPRRAFIGQPPAASDRPLVELGDTLTTPEVTLDVLSSPGHCEGHVSLYDPENGILFAGDSFMHAVFTSPNEDVSTEDWLGTLDRYARRDVRTMIGTHGRIHTRDERIPRIAFVTRRADPNRMLAEKAEFLRWAQSVVAEGERRGLPYDVIEACLFPWSRWWSWGNWFADESGRLFSAGEFSRTHFVRSLSRTPERVPPRFGAPARAASRLGRLVGGR